ncbi:MAG TPA: hypothetical protein VFU10_01080 [Gaiellaceae bacterium]|nr:hypothetical protein [Gaiellaceae bacterium]
MRWSPRAPTRLVCAECLRADRDGDGRGWKADWAGGHDHQPLELVILCPTCWTAEFSGDDGPMSF